MDTPNAFSTRSAISGDRWARSLRSVESVARVTPSTSAAPVTDRPNGSMISCRMKLPGWAGFFKPHADVYAHGWLLVVILVIEVDDLNLLPVDPKRHAPVLRYE